jgi:hypothetical protein
MIKSVLTFFLPFILLMSSVDLFSQAPQGYVLETIIKNGDTIPIYTLRETEIVDFRKERSKKYQRKYSRYYKKVIKVYPYAKVAGDLLNEYHRQIEEIEDEKLQKKYLKKAEEDLKAEFEGDLRQMTISEGIILIKLIDRETGQTSYDIVKELRGGFTAFFWQGIARFFGTNLKLEYDPNGEDVVIEDIVQQIERGEITVRERKVKTKKAEEVLSKRDQRKLKKKKNLNDSE